MWVGGDSWRRRSRSAALTIGQTSAADPRERRVVAMLRAVTPRPIWLMARLAAKFLYAITIFILNQE